MIQRVANGVVPSYVGDATSEQTPNSTRLILRHFPARQRYDSTEQERIHQRALQKFRRKCRLSGDSWRLVSIHSPFLGVHESSKLTRRYPWTDGHLCRFPFFTL